MKIKNTIKKVLAVLFIAVLSANCKKVKENFDDCGVILRFTYFKNTDNIDKFPSEVHKITIFVFDQAGNFVAKYEETGPFGATYSKRLNNLPAGNYTFVVWGDLSDNTPFTEDIGVGRNKQEGGLKLKTTGVNKVATPPEPLFYGKIENVIVKNTLNQVVTIDMMKNTKSVTAIFDGLPVSPGKEGEFVCTIVAANGEYTFDNVPPQRAGLLTYLPQTKFNVAQQQMTADFVTMRLFENNECQSRIILTFVPSDGSPPVVIMDISLTDAIKAEYNRAIDFVKEDKFVLHFKVDWVSFGNFSVEINGWIVVREQTLVVG